MPRLAVAAHFLVVRGARADRDAGVRQVRQRHQQRRPLLLDLIELDLELPDLLRARLVRGENRRRIQALPLGARDLVAGGVLLALAVLRASGIRRRRRASSVASCSSSRIRLEPAVR